MGPIYFPNINGQAFNSVEEEHKTILLYKHIFKNYNRWVANLMALQPEKKEAKMQ